MKLPDVFLIVFFLLLREISEVRGQQSCSICGGTSRTVGASDTLIFDAFRNRTVSCSLLQFEGNFGLIPSEICSNYSNAFAEQCQCSTPAPTVTGTTASPSSNLVLVESCPSQTPYYNYYPSCDICGPGMEMTNTFVFIVDVPAGCPIKTCQRLQDEGFGGQLSKSFCQDLQTYSVREACGCRLYVNPYGGDTAGYNSSGSWGGLWVIFGVFVTLAGSWYFLSHRARSESSIHRSTTTSHEAASIRNTSEEDTLSDPIIRQKVLQLLFPQQMASGLDPLSESHRSCHSMRSCDDKVTCSICLEKIVHEEQIVSGLCSHVYHRDCIMDWLQRNNNDCPLCRQLMWEPETFALIEEHVQRLDDKTKEVAFGTA